MTMAIMPFMLNLFQNNRQLSETENKWAGWRTGIDQYSNLAAQYKNNKPADAICP